MDRNAKQTDTRAVVPKPDHRTAAPDCIYRVTDRQSSLMLRQHGGDEPLLPKGDTVPTHRIGC